MRSRWCQSSVNITLTSTIDWKLPRAGSTTFVARRPTAPEPCPPRPHVSTSDASLASCRGCATVPGTRPSPCCARVLGRRGCQGRPRTPAPRGAVAHPRSFVGGEVVHHHDLPRPQRGHQHPLHVVPHDPGYNPPRTRLLQSSANKGIREAGARRTPARIETTVWSGPYLPLCTARNTSSRTVTRSLSPTSYGSPLSRSCRR